MKKTSPKKQTYPENEVTRYLGALQEENRGHYKVIGERLDGINDTLQSHTEMIGGLSVRMTSMEITMATTQETLATTQETLATTQETLEIMKQDIEFIKSGFKKKVDQDEFDALIRRVSFLERKALSSK